MPTPRYKIRPDTGDLQEYLFEYNGILALKNFVARVDGERLILHSAADMNFSILDALVSEVEIDGRVYDNAEAAQEALMRLTFNTNRPVLMTQQERELLQGALQKGTYVGTAADIKALIDGKVDKVPGKILSTNDFTNELRTKLEGLRNVDISGLLPKGGYTGTAQNLKDLIDNIMRILQSPDTELDELREIVAYIKQNKRTLDTLGISNIAGLQDALNGKAPTDHNHDDRYSRLGHTHAEYAYRTHRHRWDDIEGKPSMNFLPLTGGTLTGNVVLTNQAVFKKGSPISGYIVDCFAANNNTNNKTNPIYVIGENYKPTDDTLATMYGIGYTTNNAKFINGEDLGFPAVNGISGWGLYIAAVGKARHFLDANTGNSYQFGDSRANGFIKKGSSNDYVLLGGGGHKNMSDILPHISVKNNVICDHSHNNSVIFIENNLAIQLKDLDHLDCLSFRKVYAGGAVTFSCAGKTIIYTGDNAFNGGDGSTAVVSIWKNKCYIDIRNV